MIRFFRGRGVSLLLITLMGSLCLGGCVNKEPDRDSLFKGNRPPIARAGADQVVASGALVRLDGSASSDPDGDEIRYEWRMVSTPRGSNAQLDTPASATVGFVADTDGVYRVELRVIENVDRNLPEGAPIADSGLSSEPDEVVIIAGPPGPFDDSGNKLILDGSHFALSATVLDLKQGTDITAEGWFWINGAPPQGKEALMMGKKQFFEIVFTSEGSVLFRIYPFGGGTREVGPIPFTTQTWHHLAAVVDQGQSHRAYLVVDGVQVAGIDFTGGVNENANRFTIGGGEGKEFLVGMVDEVRVTQDVRYPEAPFDPPKALLIPDSPFVSGARFSVHGLWHFDEFVGSKLFTDFSLRRNDLFLVGNTGFQPFGRLQIPRKFNTVEALDNGDLWIAGGIDDAGRALTDTEMIQTDGQIQASSSLNPDPIKAEIFGVGDGSNVTFSHQAATRPVLPGSVTLVAGNAKGAAGNINGADDGLGHLTGIGIEAGTIDYETGQMTVTFKKPPPSYSLPINDEVLGTTAGGGGSFTATATFKPIIPGSLSIMAGGGVIAEDDQTSQLNNEASLKGGNIQSGTVHYDTGSISITFKAALGNDVSISARYDSDNSDVIPGPGKSILIDYSYDRRGGVFNHSATRLGDGKILIAGGDDKDRKLISFATLFTPGAAKPIELVGPYKIPRRFHTAGLLANNLPANRNVILVGGESDSAGTLQTLSTTELFDPGTRTFRNGPNLNQARKLHRMIFFRDCNSSLGPQDDRFLVAGGYDINNLPTKTAEVYSGGGFSPTGSMSIERVRHSVVCLSNGKMLITGGIDASGRVLDSAEVYDPTTHSFTSLQAGMNVPRADHTATLLTNGKVLIAGGFNQSEAAISSAEIYDPNQNLFLPLSTSLGLARFGHVARPWKALGKDGVIIIGGMDATGAPITLIEIFFP